jgi:hypothetical protein
MIKKSLKKLGIESAYLNITKPIYRNPIQNEEKLRAFAPRSGRK